jgi:polysaccharide export outer membrane protein
MISPLAICSFLAISACGAIYTSPGINSSSEQVAVIEMTSQSVAYANQTTYAPKRLPAIFNQVSTARRATGVGSIPSQVTQSYQQATVHLPPRVEASPYTLGVSDVILLATPSPQTSEGLTGLIAAQNKRQGYTIQDDGAIAVPDIGRIELAGQTVEEAEATIFQALVENQIDPKFSLEIADFNSKSISIGGAVRLSQVAPITLKPLTLQNALQGAGGIESLTPEFTTIRIFRGGKRYQIPLQEFRAKSNLQNFILQDGDSIFVENDFQKQLTLIEAKSQALNEVQIKTDLRRAQSEEARQNFLTKLELGAVKRDYAYLAGEVIKQGRFLLPFNNTASVADAIYSEGGVNNRNGDLGQIYVLRTTSGSQKITAFHLDAGNAVNLLLATKMQLRPNDVIFVAEQRVTAWNRVISQILPSVSIADIATD